MGALLISKKRGIVLAKIQYLEKVQTSFCKPKKVNLWSFQTQKSKFLYSILVYFTWVLFSSLLFKLS